MIDEKKITEAAIQNADKYNPCRSFTDKEEACRFSFKDGVDWFKNSLWHDAKEEPDKNKRILIKWLYKGKIYYETDIIKNKYIWQDVFTGYNFTKWCYIDDLLPKGGEE